MDVKICPILVWWKHSSLQPFQVALFFLIKEDIEPVQQAGILVRCINSVCLLGERDEPGQSKPVPVAVWVEDGRVGLARPSKSGGRSRSSRVGSHQTLNFFNQTLNGAALSPILQPNTETGWLRPQK